MSNEDFISKALTAFLKIHEKTSGIPLLEGMERQFRHALAHHLFGEVLDWEKHYVVAEIFDITCFDDENFPIIVIETKGPGITFTPEIKEKLRKRLEEVGSVKYGVFANPSTFAICEYEPGKLREIARVNVAVAVGAAKGEFGLSNSEKRQIGKLEVLKRERLVWVEDSEYFKRTHKEVSVAKSEGVNLLTGSLKEIVKELTQVVMSFFYSYEKRDDYSGKFLQSSFNDWLKLSMKSEEYKRGDAEKRQKIIEVFCRETAYVIVGRALFIRICEDKDILELTLSGKGLAEFLKFYEKRKIENIYLRAFYDSREEIRKYYSHLYELGFFDWWWISPDKLGLLNHKDRKTQESLEKDLNYSVKKCLRRINRFDFVQVNRDILGDVYQRYLPPDERKRLGEFYTPREVIEYILDAVGYKPENEIRDKKILDPACGSGSFLVEAMQRLMERYRRVGFNLKDPDDAKRIIQECITHIYGLDIHPFACFIAEMNLLFQLVDLYDIVRRKDRYYELPRLNVYRTDSLIPPGEATIELIEFMDNSRRVMLIEETRGADKIKKMEYSYVVGNPPYVRVDNIHKSYRTAYRQIYGDLLVSKWDIYIPFVYKGIEWLKADGKFGYIVSDKFFVLQHGLPLRSHILDSCDIQQIIDLSGVKVFAASLPAPAIVIMQKRVQSK